MESGFDKCGAFQSAPRYDSNSLPSLKLILKRILSSSLQDETQIEHVFTHLEQMLHSGDVRGSNLERDEYLSMLELCLGVLGATHRAGCKLLFERTSARWINLVWACCRNVPEMSALVASVLSVPMLHFLLQASLPLGPRKVMLETLRACLGHAPRDVRHNLFRGNHELVEKLVELMMDCGDFNMQVASLQTALYLAGVNSSKDRAAISGPLSRLPQVQRVFLLLEFNSFAKDARFFLNMLNSSMGLEAMVFSFPCLSVLIGREKIFQPKDVSELWVDFNYGSVSISLLYDPHHQKLPEGRIKSLTILRHDVTSVVMCNSPTLRLITVTVSRSCPGFSSAKVRILMAKSQLTSGVDNILVNMFQTVYQVKNVSDVSTAEKHNEGHVLTDSQASEDPRLEVNATERSASNEEPAPSREGRLTVGSPGDIPKVLSTRCERKNSVSGASHREMHLAPNTPPRSTSRTDAATEATSERFMATPPNIFTPPACEFATFTSPQPCKASMPISTSRTDIVVYLSKKKAYLSSRTSPVAPVIDTRKKRKLDVQPGEVGATHTSRTEAATSQTVTTCSPVAVGKPSSTGSEVVTDTSNCPAVVSSKCLKQTFTNNLEVSSTDGVDCIESSQNGDIQCVTKYSLMQEVKFNKKITKVKTAGAFDKYSEAPHVTTQPCATVSSDIVSEHFIASSRCTRSRRVERQCRKTQSRDTRARRKATLVPESGTSGMKPAGAVTLCANAHDLTNTMEGNHSCREKLGELTEQNHVGQITDGDKSNCTLPGSASAVPQGETVIKNDSGVPKRLYDSSCGRNIESRGTCEASALAGAATQLHCDAEKHVTVSRRDEGTLGQASSPRAARCKNKIVRSSRDEHKNDGRCLSSAEEDNSFKSRILNADEPENVQVAQNLTRRTWLIKSVDQARCKSFLRNRAKDTAQTLPQANSCRENERTLRKSSPSSKFDGICEGTKNESVIVSTSAFLKPGISSVTTKKSTFLSLCESTTSKRIDVEIGTVKDVLRKDSGTKQTGKASDKHALGSGLIETNECSRKDGAAADTGQTTNKELATNTCVPVSLGEQSRSVDAPANGTAAKNVSETPSLIFPQTTKKQTARRDRKLKNSAKKTIQDVYATICKRTDTKAVENVYMSQRENYNGRSLTNFNTRLTRKRKLFSEAQHTEVYEVNRDSEHSLKLDVHLREQTSGRVDSIANGSAQKTSGGDGVVERIKPKRRLWAEKVKQLPSSDTDTSFVSKRKCDKKVSIRAKARKVMKRAVVRSYSDDSSGDGLPPLVVEVVPLRYKSFASRGRSGKEKSQTNADVDTVYDKIFSKNKNKNNTGTDKEADDMRDMAADFASKVERQTCSASRTANKSPSFQSCRAKQLLAPVTSVENKLHQRPQLNPVHRRGPSTAVSGRNGPMLDSGKETRSREHVPRVARRSQRTEVTVPPASVTSGTLGASRQAGEVGTEIPTTAQSGKQRGSIHSPASDTTNMTVFGKLKCPATSDELLTAETHCKKTCSTNIESPASYLSRSMSITGHGRRPHLADEERADLHTLQDECRNVAGDVPNIVRQSPEPSGRRQRTTSSEDGDGVTFIDCLEEDVAVGPQVTKPDAGKGKDGRSGQKVVLTERRSQYTRSVDVTVDTETDVISRNILITNTSKQVTYDGRKTVSWAESSSFSHEDKSFKAQKESVDSRLSKLTRDSKQKVSKSSSSSSSSSDRSEVTKPTFRQGTSEPSHVQALYSDKYKTVTTDCSQTITIKSKKDFETREKPLETSSYSVHGHSHMQQVAVDDNTNMLDVLTHQIVKYVEQSDWQACITEGSEARQKVESQFVEDVERAISSMDGYQEYLHKEIARMERMERHVRSMLSRGTHAAADVSTRVKDVRQLLARLARDGQEVAASQRQLCARSCGRVQRQVEAAGVQVLRRAVGALASSLRAACSSLFR